MRISTLDDPFATDDEIDRALGIPTMADLLGRTDTTPDKFALPMSEPSGSVRNRLGSASGSCFPEVPSFNHERETDYKNGEQMQNGTRTTHNR